MRIVDLFFAFPFFVLVIAIVAMLGPSVFNMFVAIWLTSWISYARITRGHTLGRQAAGVRARRPKALGFRNSRVMLRHILPNVFSFVIIFAMVDAVGNVLLGVVARLPRPRREAAVARVGRDDLGRPELHLDGVVALDDPRASRSCSSASASV